MRNQGKENKLSFLMALCLFSQCFNQYQVTLLVGGTDIYLLETTNIGFLENVVIILD